MPLRLHNLSVRSAFHSGPLVVELVSRDYKWNNAAAGDVIGSHPLP